MDPSNKASTTFFAMSHVYNLNPTPPPIFNKKQKRKKNINFFFLLGLITKKSIYIYIYIYRIYWGDILWFVYSKTGINNRFIQKVIWN